MLHGARSSKAILVVPLCQSAVPGKRKVENPWGNPMVAPPTQIQNGHTKWGPRSIAKLVNITPITMVYGTQITIVTGVYKPIYNWGAPHCRNSGFTQLYSMVIWPIVMSEFTRPGNSSGRWCNNHLETYEFINGKDDIPYMKWKMKAMFETTNQIVTQLITINHY